MSRCNFPVYLNPIILNMSRLVIRLGLRSTLSEYKIPKDDLSSIASGALGKESDPELPKIVKLLEGIYSAQ